MNTTVSHQQDVAIVTPVGSVDALTAPQVTETLAARLAEGEAKLVLDMSQIDFISSAGLRMLLGAVKEARSQGGDLRLTGAIPDVQKVLQMSGFSSILKSYDDLATAVASFSA